MRDILYLFLILFSIVLFGLTAARIHYTTHLPVGDPLNSGRDFFDPVVVELLVTSLLTLFVAPVFAMIIHRRYETERTTRLWFEVLVLSIIWFMLLVGAAIATSIWPNLSFCSKFEACRLLQAMLAFAWLTWIVLTILWLSSLVFAIRYRAWNDHVHQFGWRNADNNKEMGQTQFGGRAV